MPQIVSNRSSTVAAFIIFHIRLICQVQKTANQLLLLINCSPIGLTSEGTWVANIIIVSRLDVWRNDILTVCCFDFCFSVSTHKRKLGSWQQLRILLPSADPDDKPE